MAKKQDKTMENEPKEKVIGYHIGSLETLAKERSELMRLLTIVEQLIQLHAKALKELGVDIEKLAEEKKEKKEKKKPIDDILKEI